MLPRWMDQHDLDYSDLLDPLTLGGFAYAAGSGESRYSKAHINGIVTAFNFAFNPDHQPYMTNAERWASESWEVVKPARAVTAYMFRENPPEPRVDKSVYPPESFEAACENLVTSNGARKDWIRHMWGLCLSAGVSHLQLQHSLTDATVTDRHLSLRFDELAAHTSVREHLPAVTVKHRLTHLDVPHAAWVSDNSKAFMPSKNAINDILRAQPNFSMLWFRRIGLRSAIAVGYQLGLRWDSIRQISVSPDRYRLAGRNPLSYEIWVTHKTGVGWVPLEPAVIGQSLNPVTAFDDFLTTGEQSTLVIRQDGQPYKSPVSASYHSFSAFAVGELRTELEPIKDWQQGSFRYSAATEADKHRESISDVLMHAKGHPDLDGRYVVKPDTPSAVKVKPKLADIPLEEAKAAADRLSDPAFTMETRHRDECFEVREWVDERPKRTLVSYVAHAVVNKRLMASTLTRRLSGVKALGLFTPEEVAAAEQELRLLDAGQRQRAESNVVTTVPELEDALARGETLLALRSRALAAYLFAHPQARGFEVDDERLRRLVEFAAESGHDCGKFFCLADAVSDLLSPDRKRHPSSRMPEGMDGLGGWLSRQPPSDLKVALRRSINACQMKTYASAGMGVREIADRLGQSPKTVHEQFIKLGLDPLVRNPDPVSLPFCPLVDEWKASGQSDGLA